MSRPPDHGTDHPIYTELFPGADMAPWVECYWSIRAANAPGVPNRVLPDGCTDVIVGIAGDPTPVAVGTMTTAIVIPQTGPVDLFGIRLRPGAGLGLLDVPLAELTDRRIGLDALWGREAGALASLAEPGTLAERGARAGELLRRRVVAWARAERGDEAMATAAVGLLRRARGGVGISQVAAALGVGQRRLERAFQRSVGLPPKGLARVMRFRHAIDFLARRMADPPGGWAAFALSAGYADQAHFIREFRALAGITPARYVAERRDVGFVQYGGDGTG
jgi:AraC-like DNA-binding protein